MEMLSKIGGAVSAFASPIVSIFIELFNALKGWLSVILAYWQGKKQGRKDVIAENDKKVLDNVDKIKSARNDTDNRKRVREKYIRDE